MDHKYLTAKENHILGITAGETYEASEVHWHSARWLNGVTEKTSGIALMIKTEFEVWVEFDRDLFL